MSLPRSPHPVQLGPKPGARRLPFDTGDREVWYDPPVNNALAVLRYAWAAPTTALGLLVVLAGAYRARMRLVGGVLEAEGPALAWLLTHGTLLPGGAAALTLGHVVIARDPHSLEWTRAHERVHVRQSEAWGPLFVPAYLGASVWALLRGRHFYRDNGFERVASAAGSPDSRET